jgi:hypothetical protein
VLNTSVSQKKTQSFKPWRTGRPLISKNHKNFIIRDRIRTCNLSVRSRTRYPLRHTDELLMNALISIRILNTTIQSWTLEVLKLKLLEQ